ncbi:pentraxin fusion protein-like [Haliotis rufescens]|uniref:pentraxin fusion protein-like n=1 Tax=Haliotis rufescens TaxID=6454 RepID=UPI00201F0CD5|nr:pentraxin fusion protein-like [Haliotis rufescens]
MMYISFQRFVHFDVYICCQILSCMVQFTNTCMPNLHYGNHLVGSTFKIIEKSSLFSCAAECVSYGICKSFNFEVGRRACHLNGLDDLDYLEGGGRDPDFIYSSIISWNKTTLGPCHDNQCGYTQRCNSKRNGNVHCEEFLPNIAKSKSTTSSSVYKYQPSVAVDGDLTAAWSSGSCFHVAYGDFSPWWQVDLLDNYVIVEVRVTGREDCCPERLHDFALDVYQADPIAYPDVSPQLCYMYNANVTERGKTVAIQCTSSVTGRYLRVSGKETKNELDVLQFCEVQVFGYDVIHW